MKLRLILVNIILLAWAAPGVAETVVLPAALTWDVMPLAQIEGHTAAVFDRDDVAFEDARREAEGLPWRFALPEDVQLTPDNSGTWESLPDGRLLWRLRLTGPGARSMNLGFSRFWMPGDAKLLIYAPGEPAEAWAFGREHHADHGQLWTPVVFGESIVVEVTLDQDQRDALVLELVRVNRGYRLFNEDPADKSGTCNIDVVCEQGDDWRDEIDTVGMVSIFGSEKCTGWMTNNTAQDGRPLFITAAHCALNENNDQTLVVYWNYQSPVCGQQGGGSKLDAQVGGATWLATTNLSDFTIAELTQDPDPAWNVKFAGWNRSTDDPTSAVAIHHPSTDEKSISFENDPLITSSYYGQTAPGDGSHLRVADWDEGTTEGGSSGSPLFDQDGYVVGELHGGDAACGNDSPDWYGRLSYAWDEGTTPQTRLSDHLDPDGTEAVTLEMYDPLGASFSVTPETDFSSSGEVGGPFTPATTFYTLVNTGTIPAPFTVGFGPESWTLVNPASGTIPVGGQVQVQVAYYLPDIEALPVGDYTNNLYFRTATGSPPQATRQILLNVRAGPVALSGPVPNPFIDYTEVYFSLDNPATVYARILDLRGRLVNDLGSQSYPAGENKWAWGGDAADGRRLPSGVYVFELRYGSETIRMNITQIH